MDCFYRRVSGYLNALSVRLLALFYLKLPMKQRKLMRPRLEERELRLYVRQATSLAPPPSRLHSLPSFFSLLLPVLFLPCTLQR